MDESLRGMGIRTVMSEMFGFRVRGRRTTAHRRS